MTTLIGRLFRAAKFEKCAIDDTPVGATTPSTGAFTTLTTSGAVTASGAFRLKRSTVAATGSAQGDAAALSTGFNSVTAADATKGVILPTPAAGEVVVVKNVDAAILKVYPATGGAINAVAANGSLNMAASTSAVFVADAVGQWYTVPLLPS